MRRKLVIVCTFCMFLLPISVKTNSEIGTFIDPISYYWFDTSGNYLRQNTRADEEWLTNYNSNTDNPKTLREKGYAPANCYPGSPPVPEDPDAPDVLFYSHP
jgi:hypothetical protein